MNGRVRGRRLSICYLVPGHRLLPSAGPSRNVLSLANALAEEADVTVAFRERLSDAPLTGVEVREIDPGSSNGAGGVTDDAALRGVGYREFLAYMKALRRFVRSTSHEYDVVLEKGWLLSGSASLQYRRRGVTAIPVENLIQTVSSSGRDRLRSRIGRDAGRWISGRGLRRAPRIIAETAALRSALERCYGIEERRIDVVPLGVDRERFCPRDRGRARVELGVPADRLLLLYVGVLDRIHDLDPAIRGLAGAPDAHLLVVGDGPLGGTYAELAERVGVADRVQFRGRVPHDEVPVYVGAADLCVAPYDPRAFFDDEVAYSTLKIREYLAAGRAVLAVCSGSIPELVEDGATGLLVPHEREAWARALADLPDRATLDAMGRRAAALPARAWRDVAADYLAICESAVGGISRP